jgi:DNA processing protein
MDKYIHAFWHIEGNSYQKLTKIWQYFRDFQYAWGQASRGELLKSGVGVDFAEKVLELRGKLDLSKSMDKLWRQDIFLMDWKNPEFPEELKNIAQPPFLLYRRGRELNYLSNRLAIVGMRKATVQGEKLAFGLARSLVNIGTTVVSGLAFGIDAAAHSGVVQAGGKTIGVLASGIARVMPSSHQNLADKILACGGAIISEYPVTAEALKFQFIERNRLIAGLCHTIIVVEAARRSGALITARHALEQGKEIMAFPGDPGRLQSQGCNDLIKKGEAALIDSIADVTANLAERNLIVTAKNSIIGGVELSESEKQLWNLIRENPLSTDEIEIKAELSRELMLAGLSGLEINGLILRNSEMKWQILAD